MTDTEPTEECPFCGSDDIIEGEYWIEAGEVQWYYSCMNEKCKKHWRNVYDINFNFWEETEDDGRP